MNRDRLIISKGGFNELELLLTDFGETTKKTCNAMKKIVKDTDCLGLSFHFQIDPFRLDYSNTDEEKTVSKKLQESDNVVRHAKICEELTKLYERKNHDYGDSFHQTYVEEGLAMSRIRFSDKLSRFNRLTRLAEDRGLGLKYSGEVKDESIRDTLVDLANYAIMTIMELDGEGKS